MTKWLLRDKSPNRHPFDDYPLSLPLQLSWRTKINGYVVAPAVACDGKTYVSSVKGLFALESRTGKELWRFETEHARLDDEHCHMISSPAIWKDRIYLSDDSFYVYCLNRNTGKVLWETDKLWSSNESICIYEDNLFLRTRHLGRDEFSAKEPGYVCIDPEGKVKWSMRTRGEVSTLQAAVAEGILVFGDDAGFLYGVNIENGHVSWEADLNSLLKSSIPSSLKAKPFLLPMIVDTTMIIPVGATRVQVAFDVRNGDLLWVNVSDWPVAHPAADMSSLYFICHRQRGDTVDCVAIDSGTLRWSKDISDYNLGDTSVYHNTGLVVGDHYLSGFSSSSTMAMFSAKDGHLEWTFKGEGGFHAAPIFADERIIIGDNDQYVYCFVED